VEVNIITMIFTAFVVFVCFLSVLRAMPDHNFLNGMYKKKFADFVGYIRDPGQRILQASGVHI
jgi:hypothetical protein